MKIKVGNGNKEMVLLFLVIAAELAASLVTSRQPLFSIKLCHFIYTKDQLWGE